MFTFSPNGYPGMFANPNDGQVKQAIAQATQSNAKTVLVSRQWFDRVKSTLTGLAGSTGEDSVVLPQWKLLIKVDPMITDELTFRVE